MIVSARTDGRNGHGCFPSVIRIGVCNGQIRIKDDFVGFGGRDLSDGAGAEMKGARREEWTTSVRNAANTAGDDDNDKAMGRTAVAVPDDSPRMRPAAASMRVRSFSTLRCAAAFGAPFAIWKRQCPAAPVNALGARRLESVSTSASRIRRLASLPAIGRLGPSTVRARALRGAPRRALRYGTRR